MRNSKDLSLEQASSNIEPAHVGHSRTHGVALKALAVGAIALVAGCGGIAVQSDPTPLTRAPLTTTAQIETQPAPETLPPTTTTTMPPFSAECRSLIETLTLRDQLAQMVMVGVNSASSAEVDSVINNYHVGGVFIGGESTELLTSGHLNDLVVNAPLGLWVAVDDEGGRVQRVDDIVDSILSPRRQANSMSPQEVADLGYQRGRALRSYGVTMNLAPVTDLSDRKYNEVIGDRSYSNDPDTAIIYATAFAQGLSQAGVFPVIKHFPGHGKASGDSHTQAVSTPDISELGADLRPYQEIPSQVGVAVMMGHLVVPGLTNGQPASTSPEAVKYLRDTIGFEGVVMTDSLGMAAATQGRTLIQAGVDAVKADVDVVLYTGVDIPALLTALETAINNGTIEQSSITASVARILESRGVSACQD